MVVLEEGSMLTTGHNQYLQPDYLSPLPTTLDAKKSPLALLAQTCSQIGADSPSKPLISSLDKSSKGSSARSPPAAKLERNRGSPSDGNHNNNNNNSNKSSSNLAFKPYETNVVSTKRSSTSDDNSRPASKASSVHSASGNNSGPDSANNSASGDGCSESSGPSSHKKSRSTPLGRKSASPASSSHQTPAATSHVHGHSNSSSPSGADRKTPADRDKSSASPRHQNGASPVIRSGMEILSGHSAKDSAASAAAAAAAAANLQNMYKAQYNQLCCPPGLAENPAFRPPFGASPFSHHHAAAAALLGYPGAGSPTNNPYLGYARVKTPSGGETLVPVCKDPYCTGCQYSMHNAQMMMAAAANSANAAAAAAGGACPSGCTQCDHQKYGLMALSSLGPMPPPSMSGYPSSLSGASAAAAAAGGGRAHVCNWIAGESYCGKRFGTSEELLQHLRSHTSLANGAGAGDPSATAALLAGQHSQHPLLSPTAALHRAAAAAAAAGSYPAPSLSPLSGRYHPYGKPPTGPMPASLAASPYSAFNALGPYYSPYAIYGQRIGAAVHP